MADPIRHRRLTSITSRNPRPTDRVAERFPSFRPRHPIRTATAEHIIPARPVNIRLTGRVQKQRHQVFVDTAERYLTTASFQLLMEMALLRLIAATAPFVRGQDETYCCRSEASLRKSVERLRLDLGDGSLIYNNDAGGYCLAIDPSGIDCDSYLFQLDDDRVPTTLLADFRSVLERFQVMFRSQSLQ